MNTGAPRGVSSVGPRVRRCKAGWVGEGGKVCVKSLGFVPGELGS